MTNRGRHIGTEEAAVARSRFELARSDSSDEDEFFRIAIGESGPAEAAATRRGFELARGDASDEDQFFGIPLVGEFGPAVSDFELARRDSSDEDEFFGIPLVCESSPAVSSRPSKLEFREPGAMIGQAISLSVQEDLKAKLGALSETPGGRVVHGARTHELLSHLTMLLEGETPAKPPHPRVFHGLRQAFAILETWSL
eukprot:TRINITY_DN2354_c0_g1_i1.p1 TRINITY_DN2354_c0_g1~~TRINITY_DN2354_c0_g1_i1.p1  ORF type:complete len:217 (-),score=34.96 TRINITY_DN2354_c0_g1_i1:64-657(-)